MPSTGGTPTAAAAPKVLFPEPLIDRKNFEDWSQACRVRQVEARYNEMLDLALKENLSLDEYIKKNFKDHTAFLLTCPKFNLFCWPSALAELGSGVVLYFHFLIFLGLFLFLAFIVQIPAVMEYWDKDNFYMWKEKANDDSTEVLSNFFIYTSPGMLGPGMSDSDDVPFCYFVLVSFLCGLVVAKSAWQMRVDYKCDEGTTHPNDFAIMVEGLPATATDEQAIMDFFKENAVRGQNDVEVVKVVIGWDAKEYREKMRRLKEIREELQNIPPLHPKCAELQEEMARINADLQSTASTTASRLQSSGVVVVSFRFQSDLRRCVDRWTSLWATWAYRDWGGCCGLFGGPPLPRFTGSGIVPWKIKVRRAPNPGDLNWDDLGVEKSERWKRLAQSNLSMLLIIGASFALCFGMITIKDSIDSPWLSFLPAIGIMAANIGMIFSAKYFGSKEFHTTNSEQEGSQALKMCLGNIVNTAVVMAAINPKDYEWYKSSGLVSDIMTLIACTAVIQPLFQLVDMKYMTFKSWSRSKLNEQDLQELRNGASYWNSNPPNSKETLADFKAFAAKYKQTESFFKSAFEPSDMDMKRRYAYAVRTFVCCMCYCHLIPFICLVGILGIVVQYWVDKRMLLNWYKRSSTPQGKDQAMMSLYFLRFTTLLMPLCMWFFISPSYRNHDTIIYWMVVSYGPALALCLLPLNKIRQVLCAPCRGWNQARRVSASDELDDYYTAQYMWPRELKYHKSHRLYLGLSEKQNPEMLDPNKSSVTKADDVKASYGVSAAKAGAAASEAKSGGAVTLAGGAAVGGDGDVTTGASTTSLPPPGGDPPAAAVTPTVVGVPSGPGDDPAATPAAPAGDDIPAVTPLLAGPGAGGGWIAPAGGPCWEMEIGHWSRFDDDCHDHLENQYQKFKNKGGPARITVRTKGMSLSVDFEKMTQMRKEHGKHKGKPKVYKIRRSEGP